VRFRLPKMAKTTIQLNRYGLGQRVGAVEWESRYRPAVGPLRVEGRLSSWAMLGSFRSRQPQLEFRLEKSMRLASWMESQMG